MDIRATRASCKLNHNFLSGFYISTLASVYITLKINVLSHMYTRAHTHTSYLLGDYLLEYKGAVKMLSGPLILVELSELAV